MTSNHTSVGMHITLGAKRTPGRVAVALVDGPRQTYRELDAVTNRIVHALQGAGVRPGDRVAIWMENSLEYLDTYLACLKAGFVIVQINIRHTAPEADFQLGDSGATVLIFSDAVAERVEQLTTRDGFELLLTTGTELVGNARAFHSFISSAQDAAVHQPTDPETLAVIGYTSGTTGHPKGVELTHRSLRNIGVTNAISCRYSLASRQILGLSLSFTSVAPAHVLPHLYVGGTTFLMNDWDTERMVTEIEREHATFTILPSPAIMDFIDLAKTRSSTLPSLTSVLHSASKAPAQHLEAFVEHFGPRLLEGWGMTENSGGLVTATTVADYATPTEGTFDSAGSPVPDTLVQVIDDDGSRLAEDGETVGQLLVRSGSLARGYWQNPEATAQAFVDGWYYSGDLGTVSPDGNVTVIDRRKDLIVSGGINVYPSEIERVLSEFEGVREAVVTARTHERWGQVPVAFIVQDETKPIDVERLLGHCRSQLAGYKIPSEVRVLDEFPRNASGKVLRGELRAD